MYSRTPGYLTVSRLYYSTIAITA